MKENLESIFRNLFPNKIGRIFVRIFSQKFPVGVLAIIKTSNKVLLVKQIHTQGEVWRLPGGFVEKGENPKNAIQREIKEELGFELDNNIRLLNAYFDKGFAGIIIVYEKKLDEMPLVNPSGEIIKSDFFNIKDLPKNTIRSHEDLIYL